MTTLFDDLLLTKFSGHCHHYFQEVGLEISLITLVAWSDYVSSNLFLFQVRKYPEMCYTLHRAARAGLDVARKTRPK